MKKETIGNATLYLGDCLEILPTLDKVDAMITDPPYGIESIVGGYSRDGKTIQNDKDLTVCKKGLEAAWNILSDGWAAVFYSCRISPDFFMAVQNLDYFGEIIWDKKMPGMGGSLRYMHENIALFRKGTTPLRNNIFSLIEDCRNPDQHPHQKPQKIMTELVNATGRGIVLAPFMGSGSTGVACMNLGRKFIGVEIEERYFNIACERIDQSQKQQRLFV